MYSYAGTSSALLKVDTVNDHTELDIKLSIILMHHMMRARELAPARIWTTWGACDTLY